MLSAGVKIFLGTNGRAVPVALVQACNIWGTLRLALFRAKHRADVRLFGEPLQQVLKRLWVHDLKFAVAELYAFDHLSQLVIAQNGY